MKYLVACFKSLEVALKAIESFIRHGEHLQTGKPFDKFGGMRLHEISANWLLCVTINSIDNRQLMFSSDPIGGDGIISDSTAGETWQTEHLMVPRLRPGDTGHSETFILRAIEHKRSKGRVACARGKTLAVFMDAGSGIWLPSKVARHLPNPLPFATAWVVGLHGVEEGEYVYNVAQLDISEGNAPAVLVRIRRDFDTWSVETIQ